MMNSSSNTVTPLCTAWVATLLLSASATAQVELVHYDFVGPVDELGAPATTIAPGFSASDMMLVGASPLTAFTDTFAADGWSNSVTPDLAQYIVFSVNGTWSAGEIRHDWFRSSFGPLEVAVRTNLDGYTTDVATASRPPGPDLPNDYQISLDITSLGNLAGTTTFRLYYYGGSDGGNPSFNTLFIDGTGFGMGDIGLKVFDGTPPLPTTLCNGNGGDQMGCTDCPCGNNASIFTAGGCLNSANTSTLLESSGDPSVSLPSGSMTDLRFALTGAPPTSFCILNSGDALAPQNMANPCFGLNSGAQAGSFDGLRCAVMNTLRHGGRSADSNGQVGVTNNPWGGEGGPPVGIAQAGGGFSAGQTRYFQVIHRDDPMAVCMRGLNTSQAVEVTFTP